jgi:hypothetical protein
LIQSGIDNTQTSQKWRELWSLLGDSASPFFSEGYYRASQSIENARVECFWAYQDESNFLFYPYLIKSVNVLGYDLDEQYFDVSGAYGYNGPLGVAEDQKFLSEYNSRLPKSVRQRKWSCLLGRDLRSLWQTDFATPGTGSRVMWFTQIYADKRRGLPRIDVI